MIGTFQQRLRIGGAVLAAVALAGSLLAACSSAGTGTSSPGGLTVEGAWARNAPKTAQAGAAYLVVKNSGSADALVGASSPVSGMVQVHETYVVESPTGSAMPGASADMVGTVMGMRPVARIDIPAGGSIELKPGGYHIMLMELKQELKAGDTIEITLTFEKAGPVTVKAEVRES